MRKPCIALLLLAVVYVRGAGVKAGKERLRELVVFPTINLTSTYNARASRSELLDAYLVPGEITKLQNETKEHPDDPDRLLQLAALLDRSHESNETKACYEQVERAARKKLAVRPQDGLTLTCLGIALGNLGNDTEAESVFRKATLVSSNKWKCWEGLGTFLADKAFNGLMPKSALNSPNSSLDSLLPSIGNYQPPAELLAESAKLQGESEQCFDRAVALAPKEPDVYLGRGNIQLSFGVVEFLERYYRDRQPPDAARIFQIYHPVVSIRDFDEAARLCPDDCRVVGLAAWYKGTIKMFELTKEHPDEPPTINILSEETQASLHEAISRLETLGQSGNKENASGALERVGFIKIMLLHDFSGAKADLRRAVTLEPSRDKAWELLLATSVSTEAPPDETVSICESLVKCKNSAENHLLLAKALSKENKFTETAAEIKKAADLEPDNVPAVLFATALAMKGNGDGGDLSLANQLLMRAQDLIQKMPRGEDQIARERELLLDGAIFDGLADKPGDAKKCLNMVLERFPNDQAANDIMSAIQ